MQEPVQESEEKSEESDVELVEVPMDAQQVPHSLEPEPQAGVGFSPPWPLCTDLDN